MKNLILTGKFSLIHSALSVVVFLCLVVPSAVCQKKDDLKKANDLFDEGRYRESLIYLNRIEKLENSAPLLFKRGLCLYHTNVIDQALADFKRSIEYGYNNSLSDYYIASIHHHKGQFKEAAEAYKRFLNAASSDDPMRQAVIMAIRQCGHAIQIAYRKPLAIIENPGNPVNSIYDDIGWMESPEIEQRSYFNSNRPNTALSMAVGHYDIYKAERINDKWEADRLPYPINTRSDEIAAAISQAGDALTYYKGDMKGASIEQYSKSVDQGTKKSLLIPADLSKDNPSIFFYSDDRVLFAADLPGGMGGLDLYYSILNDGIWSPPINVGPGVNTIYDERSPYITNEGHILYFSSNRPESVGGFDIFRSTFLYESQRWSEPENLGVPINSPGDDLYFTLAQDGLLGYFSSDRKNALGGMDIYFARFMEKQRGQEYYTGSLSFLDETVDSLSSNLVDYDQSIDERDIDISASPPVEALEIIQYDVPPLFVEAQKELLSKRNIAILGQVADLMKRYTQIETELYSHSHFGDIIEYNLYASLKQAERIRQYLINLGIDAQRLSIKGLGDNYPLMKTVRNGGDPSLAAKYNARIEFKFHNVPDHLDISDDDGIEVPELMKDTKYELYRAIVDASLTYKIQIATVSQMYRGMALSLFNDSCIEPDPETGLYAYTIGLYDNYSKALKTKRELEREGLVNTKVIPYVDDRRLLKEDLVYYVNKYPDLKNYMNYVNMIGSN